MALRELHIYAARQLIDAGVRAMIVDGLDERRGEIKDESAAAAKPQ